VGEKGGNWTRTRGKKKTKEEIRVRKKKKLRTKNVDKNVRKKRGGESRLNQRGKRKIDKGQESGKPRVEKKKKAKWSAPLSKDRVFRKKTKGGGREVGVTAKKKQSM